MGPDNARCAEALPVAGEMFTWLAESCTPDRMRGGGFATTIHEAAARGDISQESVVPLMAAYSIPAFDTTISTIGSAIWLFARYPEEWSAVRHDRSLIMSAINEVLRVEAPIPLFARVLTGSYIHDSYVLDGGSASCCCSRRRTETSGTIPTPTASTCVGGPSIISASVTAYMYALGRDWPR
jgi:cytochrome P450